MLYLTPTCTVMQCDLSVRVYVVGWCGCTVMQCDLSVGVYVVGWLVWLYCDAV